MCESGDYNYGMSFVLTEVGFGRPTLIKETIQKDKIFCKKSKQKLCWISAGSVELMNNP